MDCHSNRNSNRLCCEKALGNQLQEFRASSNPGRTVVHWNIGEFAIHYRVSAEYSVITSRSVTNRVVFWCRSQHNPLYQSSGRRKSKAYLKQETEAPKVVIETKIRALRIQVSFLDCSLCRS